MQRDRLITALNTNHFFADPVMRRAMQPGASARWRWSIGIIGLLMLVLALSALLATGLWRSPERRFSHRSPITSIAFAPDGQTITTASGDGVIKLWQFATGDLQWVLRGHAKWVSAITFAPDGQTLASASWDHTIKLWQARDGRLLHTLTEPNLVWDVAFAPDGQTLASASEDGTIRLWRVRDGTLLRTLHSDTKAVYSVAFLPDGQTLVSGGTDQTVKLWRVRDGTLLRALPGHGGRVLSVAVSPDGAVIASGAWNNTVNLWRASDGTLLQSLQGHTGRVFSVSFAPDGQRLLSSGEDGVARVWRVRDGALLATMSAQQRQLADCGIEQGWQVLRQCRIEASPNLLVYAATFSPDAQHRVMVDGLEMRVDPVALPFGYRLNESLLFVCGGVLLLIGVGLIVFGVRYQHTNLA